MFAWAFNELDRRENISRHYRQQEMMQEGQEGEMGMY
jgi:hypothetical protein